ncbi:MAG: DUF2087 domain-containing protein [Chloroflexota bacterium]
MKTVDREQMLIRLFARDGRLKAIPSTRPNRRVQLEVVLERLAREFEPGRRYREPEVNTILNRFYEDQCTLRRYLADYGYLQREAGWYWRAERGEEPATGQSSHREG